MNNREGHLDLCKKILYSRIHFHIRNHINGDEKDFQIATYHIDKCIDDYNSILKDLSSENSSTEIIKLISETINKIETNQSALNEELKEIYKDYVSDEIKNVDILLDMNRLAARYCAVQNVNLLIELTNKLISLLE